jgi:hypothetical protein
MRSRRRCYFNKDGPETALSNLQDVEPLKVAKTQRDPIDIGVHEGLKVETAIREKTSERDTPVADPTDDHPDFQWRDLEEIETLGVPLYAPKPGLNINS